MYTFIFNIKMLNICIEKMTRNKNEKEEKKIISIIIRSINKNFAYIKIYLIHFFKFFVCEFVCVSVSVAVYVSVFVCIRVLVFRFDF